MPLEGNRKMTHAEMIAKIKTLNAQNSVEIQATEKQIAFFTKLSKLSKQSEKQYRDWGACPFETQLSLMIEMGRVNKKGLSHEINSYLEAKQQARIAVMTALHA
ncbi:MAG: hypothetical protein EBX40_01640 [Gammaproteobacteria bacterium]|nr:hypothetical protein [Gammaproteobacteria bacterium]